MNLLHKIIQTTITERGSLSLGEYMRTALLHPAHGYYTSRDPLGTKGDFVTAPETSQIFGEMLFVWVVQQYWAAGKPEKFALLEMGPGRGTLMDDFLRAAAIEPEFLQAMQLYMLEASPVLRAKQAEKLSAFNPVFIDDLAALPPLPLFVVANEFFDALPVEQYQVMGGQWQRKAVVNHDNAFVFAAENIPASEVPPDIIKRAPATWTEYSADSIVVMQQLAAHIHEHDGAILAIDYGYQKQAEGDSVQALKNHAYHDVLADAGEADITAHVDFTALAHAAAPLRTAVISQQDFLNNLGARERLLSLCKDKDEATQQTLNSGYQRLTADEEMGRLFKVLMVVP